MRAHPHERFSSQVRLSPSAVADYARAAGDDNPVHHDPSFAAATRFGRLIASGTHTTALLLGLTAAHFSRNGAMVGLEFWVRFRRPVYADETIGLEVLCTKPGEGSLSVGATALEIKDSKPLPSTTRQCW